MPKRYMSRRNRCTGCARVMLALQDALRHSAPSGYATLAETLVLLIKLNSKLKESGEGNQVFVDSPDCSRTGGPWTATRSCNGIKKKVCVIGPYFDTVI